MKLQIFIAKWAKFFLIKVIETILLNVLINQFLSIIVLRVKIIED